MSADGSGTRRLTSTKEDDAQPTWSPDGDRIAFARGAPSRLFVMDADGSGARRVTDEEADESEPAWSPDGRWIAYVRREPGSSIRELWLVRPGRLAAAPADEARRRGSGAGVVAGRTADRRSPRTSTSKRFDIYTIGVDGKDVRLMTSRDDSFEPAWSPDGKTIAFSEGGAIVAIDVANGEERSLTDPDNNDSSPAWAPQISE